MVSNLQGESLVELFLQWAAVQYRCPLPGVQLSLYKTSFSDRNLFMLLAQPTRVEFIAERQVMVESLLTSGCVYPFSA
jgi:hypothetical protein